MHLLTIATHKIRDGMLLALFALLGLMVPAVAAKDKPSQPETWQTARVIAHLPVTGGPVSEMFLDAQNRRQYLFIRQPSKHDFTVIDVTRPDRPTVADNVSLPTRSGEKLRMVDSGLALDETPESSGNGSAGRERVPARTQPTASASRPTESVRLLDLSDPQNPRTLQTFKGVTSVLTDDGRGLIYIANDEGLWILRHREYQRMPLCDSESVFSPIRGLSVIVLPR